MRDVPGLPPYPETVPPAGISEVLAFVILMVIALGLIMAFPQIALWLPSQFTGR